MVQNTAKWGRAKARARYGNPKVPAGMNNPPDESRPERLGDSDNLQGPDYDNKHPNDWVIGKGESAEGKPGFDKD